MVAVRWTDGREDRAPHWSSLLRRLNQLDWNRHMDEAAFREELARRAFVWCGEPVVHPTAEPPELFAQLEEAGLLTRIPA